MNRLHWHDTALDLIRRGIPRKQIAALFRVSLSAICQIQRRENEMRIQAPDWVPEILQHNFSQIAFERGRAVAEDWARFEMEGSCAPVQPRSTHPWNASNSEAAPS